MPNSYEDTNCDSLLNLSIYDPPRWGWSANGGIVDLLTPHEKARRAQGRRDFLSRRIRAKKKIARDAAEEEAAAKRETRASKEDVDDSSPQANIPDSKRSIDKTTTTADENLPSANDESESDPSSSKIQEALPMICKPAETAKPVEEPSITSKAIAHKPALEDQVVTSTNASAKIEKETATGAGTNDTAMPMSIDAIAGSSKTAQSSTNCQSANETNPQHQGQSENEKKVSSDGPIPVATTSMPTEAVTESKEKKKNAQKSASSKNMDQEIDSIKFLRKTYGISPHYNLIIKDKAGSKRDRFDLEVKSIQEDGTVHRDAYHRGVVLEEVRQRGRGNLLCDTEQTDTNHFWDETSLKVRVRIEFPLCEPDWSDEEFEMDANANLDREGKALRRNARRGEARKFVSEIEQRVKREAKLAAMPHFRDEVEWDLSNARTPTPMVYATNVASEFGLSFCRTLDLARSIQSQIDEFVRENVDYHAPISSKYISLEDMSDKPRPKETLQLPNYTKPKLLYGGHCATDVTTRSSMFEPKDKDSASKTATMKKKDTIAPVKAVKAVNVHFEVCPPDQLPKHDLSKLRLDPIYEQEFMRRAKEENRAAIKRLADGNVGVCKIIENHSCHFCHLRRPIAVQFPCGNDAHCYCDLHTSRRLGFRAAQAPGLGIDYCPICTLQCTCYRCTGRLSTLVPQFAEECKAQGVGPKEVDFNFLYHCSRNLAKVAKRGGDKKATSLSTFTRRKSQATTAAAAAHSTGTIVKVEKVPYEEFPAELSANINKDPSLKDDYVTIFTPEGTSLCEKAVKKYLEKQAERKVVPVAVEDGNVDYCDICKKTGGLICCSKCPRGFHKECLPGDTQSPNEMWECHRCLEDSAQQPEDLMKGEFYLEKISAVFKEFSERGDFEEKVQVLSKIFDMVKFLKDYDFGTIFSEPVDTKLVRDYKIYVKRPMDLGTISANLLKGLYCKLPNPKNVTEAESATKMDMIILNVLKDVDQIWHNCFTYNREGSSFYRMGQVLQRKAAVIRLASFDAELDPFVRKNLDVFVEECKVKRQELSNSLKPWIPTSKYSINVPSRGGSNKRAIGIFDKDTNMVIKQYTSFSAAFHVAEFLTKLGHKSEIKTSNKQKVKEHIIAMHDTPSLLLFGFRWLYMDNIRSGNFKAAKKLSNAVVEKRCKISKCVLEQYISVEKAYRGWFEDSNNCVGVSQPHGSQRTIEHFRRCYLDGDYAIDEKEWVWVGTNSAVQSNETNTSNEKGLAKFGKGSVEKTSSNAISTTVAPIVSIVGSTLALSERIGPVVLKDINIGKQPDLNDIEKSEHTTDAVQSCTPTTNLGIQDAILPNPSVFDTSKGKIDQSVIDVEKSIEKESPNPMAIDTKQDAPIDRVDVTEGSQLQLTASKETSTLEGKRIKMHPNETEVKDGDAKINASIDKDEVTGVSDTNLAVANNMVISIEKGNRKSPNKTVSTDGYDAVTTPESSKSRSEIDVAMSLLAFSKSVGPASGSLWSANKRSLDEVVDRHDCIPPNKHHKNK